MKDKYIVATTGIICITALGVACILKGIDGAIATAISAGIGSIVGYAFGHRGGK